MSFTPDISIPDTPPTPVIPKEKPKVMELAGGDASERKTRALGRDSLKIDRTDAAQAAAGTGLNLARL